MAIDAPTWSAMATATTLASSGAPVSGVDHITNRPTSTAWARTVELQHVGQLEGSVAEPEVVLALDEPGALEPGQDVVEGGPVEPAVLQLEQPGQLRLGRLDHGGHPLTTGDQAGHVAQAAKLVTALLGRAAGPAGARRQRPDRDADDEEQDRRLDVVLAGDAEREVRAGVEEVEGQRPGDGGDHPGDPSPDGGDEHDHHHDGEHDRGVREVGPERDQEAGDGRRHEDAEADADAPFQLVVPLRHRRASCPGAEPIGEAPDGNGALFRGPRSRNEISDARPSRSGRQSRSTTSMPRRASPSRSTSAVAPHSASRDRRRRSSALRTGQAS